MLGWWNPEQQSIATPLRGPHVFDLEASAKDELLFAPERLSVCHGLHEKALDSLRIKVDIRKRRKDSLLNEAAKWHRRVG